MKLPTVDTHTEELRRLGPYRIEKLIGRGGMGEVYLAWDPRLERRVAIKHIRAESAENPVNRERLRREARAVAGLSHAAIVQIFDILDTDEDDGDWIVMEYVDGVTVHSLLQEGALELRLALTIAWDVANGLAAAHANGILHRDLKAENVMVTATGEAKILDFGLAKRFEGRLDEATLSLDGAVVGTGRAMSPEQAHGLELDPRSDLFSLGVLLYEMGTGSSPFHAPSLLRTLMRVCEHTQLSASLKNPELPQPLSDLIDHLLEKDPDRRPQSAREVAARLAEISEALPRESGSMERALSRVDTDRVQLVNLDATTQDAPHLPSRAPSVPPPKPRRRRALALAVGLVLAAVLAVAGGLAIRSRDAAPAPGSTAAGTVARPVAGDPSTAPAAEPLRLVVLPFETRGSEENTYFAAGLTEEITRRLAQISGLGVISRTSASRLSEAGKTVREIGAELDVAYVLEGTVTWPTGSLGGVRITPQLIRVVDDTYVWTEAYERPLDDSLQVQTEIAGQVAEELGVALLKPERQALAAHTEVPAAYFAYLRGLDHAHSSTVSEDAQRRAVSMFESAVAEDPEFADAWAELSRARSLIYLNYERSETLREKARHALERAQRLAPDLPDVRLAAAYYLYHVESSYDRAIDEFTAAGRRLPNSAEVASGIGFVMRRQGRLERAAQSLEAAFAYDRANARLAANIAETYRSLRRHEDADEWFAKALELDPDMPEILAERAENLMAWKGCAHGSAPHGCDTSAAREMLDSGPIDDDPELYPQWLQLDLFDRRFEDALARVRAAAAGRVSEEIRQRWFLREILAYREAGMDKEADILAQTWCRQLEKQVAKTGFYLNYGRLGLAYALVGRHDEAVAAARKATRLAGGDHYTGPRTREDLAVVLVLGGELDEAVDILDDLLSLDYQHSLTTTELRLDPVWDPLRRHARFQRLAARAAGP